jgi:hypothetical protein
MPRKVLLAAEWLLPRHPEFVIHGPGLVLPKTGVTGGRNQNDETGFPRPAFPDRPTRVWARRVAITAIRAASVRRVMTPWPGPSATRGRGRSARAAPRLRRQAGDATWRGTPPRPPPPRLDHAGRIVPWRAVARWADGSGNRWARRDIGRFSRSRARSPIIARYARGGARRAIAREVDL